MMTPKEVLTNLRAHENMWEYDRYRMSKDEADVIITLLEAVVEYQWLDGTLRKLEPITEDGMKKLTVKEWDMFSDTEQSLKKLMDVVKR